MVPLGRLHSRILQNADLPASPILMHNSGVGSIWILVGKQYIGNLTMTIFYSFGLPHGLRTPREDIAFTAQPKIQSQSQIFRYNRSIFCLPHLPKFSDVFDLCLYWVSVGCGLPKCAIVHRAHLLPTPLPNRWILSVIQIRSIWHFTYVCRNQIPTYIFSSRSESSKSIFFQLT